MIENAYKIAKKMEIKEMAMAASIRYCVFRATEVLISARVVSASKAIVPVSRRSFTVVPQPK